MRWTAPTCQEKMGRFLRRQITPYSWAETVSVVTVAQESYHDPEFAGMTEKQSYRLLAAFRLRQSYIRNPADLASHGPRTTPPSTLGCGFGYMDDY